jgi:NADPH:quinone reductase-like Zn-dependent oxidoreductase
VFHEHGGREVLKYEDVPEPKPGPTDVIIKVQGASVNYNDVWARQGLPGMKFDLPHISGSDVAGEVAEVGSAVATVRVGDRVIIHPGLSCRICAACTSGNEYFCRQFKIYGFQTGPLDGAYAEYARIPEVNAIPMPSNLSWEEGAAKALGADECINYNTQDVVAEVKRLTGRKGVEVVFEHTGEATWERSIQAMAWGGRLVICGVTTGFEGRTDLRFLFQKQLSLLGSHQGNKAELVEGLKAVEAGKVKPVVDTVLPLREAARAHEMIETGGHFGKIVLKP